MHDFLDDDLGVPEDAEKLRQGVASTYAKAFYYPFLATRILPESDRHYTASLLQADQITREKPEMVCPSLWETLKPESPAGIARKSPDFHVFFNPELPHQTAYDAGKRIYQIGVGDENSLPLLQSILERCPGDYSNRTTSRDRGRPDC